MSNFLTVGALVLWVATTVLWGLSYFYTIGWRFFSQDAEHSWTTDVETVRGGIQFRQDIRTPYSFVVWHGPSFGRQSRGLDEGNFSWIRQVVIHLPRTNNSTATRLVLAAPWFPLFVLTAMLSYRGLMDIRRRRWINWCHLQGRCIACGYDLRATPEKCPECGRRRFKRAGSISTIFLCTKAVATGDSNCGRVVWGT